jgi:hypothetical protein
VFIHGPFGGAGWRPWAAQQKLKQANIPSVPAIRAKEAVQNLGLIKTPSGKTFVLTVPIQLRRAAKRQVESDSEDY